MPKSDDSTQERLPTMEELPFSDDKPLDGELQEAIPHLLQGVLYRIWGEYHNWFFGVRKLPLL
ncbi:MAG: hypothetical protein F6K17_35190, partial [Okeania sp. SIO3C4]|nr:hypothetical protein [Okeania sp. SIO3C4]